MNHSVISPLQNLVHPLFTQAGVEVFIKRDDLIHPIISGNKWRKLTGNIAEAKRLNKKGILSFGGAYSNHIHALAFACKENHLNAIGLIRGEPHYQTNYTLSWAHYWGMQFNFVDRVTYKKRYDKEYLATLSNQYPNHLIVPEGGSNQFALTGTGEVITELNSQIDYDSLILPVGSGGTISGLIKADSNQHKIIGICVLKDGGYLHNDITHLVDNNALTNWTLMTDYHRGGYAKFTERDCQRIFNFSRDINVPFEPVYSGKMLLALLDLIRAGHFARGHRIVMLHTGGMQGLGGLIERNKVSKELLKEAQLHLPFAPLVQ